MDVLITSAKKSMGMLFTSNIALAALTIFWFCLLATSFYSGVYL